MYTYVRYVRILLHADLKSQLSAAMQFPHSRAKLTFNWGVKPSPDPPNNWEGKIYFSHGASNSTGVAILIKNNVDVEVCKVKHITQGRALLLEIKYNSVQYCLVNKTGHHEPGIMQRGVGDHTGRCILARKGIQMRPIWSHLWPYGPLMVHMGPIWCQYELM